MNKQRILVFLATLSFATSSIYAFSLLSSQIVFGFDQARDAYEAFTIYNDYHLKIMGPSSDVPGLNHGVLWYYVLAVAYFLGNGIPENAALVILTALYLSIPLIAFLTFKITKNVIVTATAISLYVMSPLFISFSHWLSNPTLSLFISPVLLYMLWKYLHMQKPIYAGLIGLLYGLLIQSDFGFVILLLVLPLYFYVFHLKFFTKNTIFFGFGLFIGTATFFISYIKFQTNVPEIVSNFVFRHSSTNFPVTTVTLSLIDNIVKFLNFTYFPLPQLLTFFILMTVLFLKRKIFFQKKDKLTNLLLVWMSGILLIFIFNHGSLGAIFFYGPFLFPLALLIAIYLVKILKDFRFLVGFLIIILVLQFLTSYSWSKAVTSPLSVQQGMTINYEKQLVDYTYESAEGEPFVIITITNPLFINTTWSYLYDVYGKEKNGYVPYLWGRDQAGYLGNLPMQTTLTSTKLRYLISEPPEGIDELWAIKITYEEDKLSKILEEKKFGAFTVQKRLFDIGNEVIVTPEALLKHPKVLNF